MWNPARPWRLRSKAQAAGIVLLWISIPQTAWAYPELVRHGYQNCVTCHHSPDGGGILTEYGRNLSRDVLSTAGGEGEGAFAYGLVKPPAWLDLGGDLRTLSIYQEDRPERRRYILMQADLEAAVTLGKWSAVGTVGRLDTAIYPSGSSWISRRHYVLYRPADELTVRAGRFLHNFGIHTEEHAISTKRGLGWDEGTETYNLEAAWLSEKWNVYASGNFGRPDAPELRRETGVSGTVGYAAGETYKVGASYFYGSNDFANRNVFGPWAILGITHHCFVLAEVDFQRLFAANAAEPQWGAVDYLRADYEFIQGLHLFAAQELSRLDFSREQTFSRVYTVGTQFFPRPHFELELLWQPRQSPVFSPDYQNWFFFMFHFYP